MILTISCSLNPDSNSRVLAQEAHRVLSSEGHAAAFLDLREFPLPFCDGDTAYRDPNVQRLGELVRQADGVLLASPIYNYDNNAAAKNLIELTGSAWENKVVGLLCAAGGMSSYMSIMSYANSLMLDFRSLVVPRFVYATGSAVSGGEIVSGEIKTRVADLARFTAKLAGAVKGFARDDAR